MPTREQSANCLATMATKISVEISAPEEGDDEKKWLNTADNIKTCVKEFLQQQCGWQRPDNKDAHLQGPALASRKVED
jgi:hypothetical protein